jgi:hypothetical protein
MRRLILGLALSLVLAATPALAATDGWHAGRTDCVGGDTDTTIRPGKFASWCPISDVDVIVRVDAVADCNWNGDTSGTGAGSATLSVKACTSEGTSTAACKTPLVDSNGDPWVVTSNTDTAHFSLSSGLFLITSSATDATGLLYCSGRQ